MKCGIFQSVVRVLISSYIHRRALSRPNSCLNAACDPGLGGLETTKEPGGEVIHTLLVQGDEVTRLGSLTL